MRSDCRLLVIQLSCTGNFGARSRRVSYGVCCELGIETLLYVVSDPGLEVHSGHWPGAELECCQWPTSRVTEFSLGIDLNANDKHGRDDTEHDR